MEILTDLLTFKEHWLACVIFYVGLNCLVAFPLIESFLAEVQFQNEYGVNWVLADGRSAVGTKYQALTGNTTVPDMRGQFLRGKNNGRNDGNENPDGEVALGSFQDDATAANGLGGSTNTAGNHRHSYTIGDNFNGPPVTQRAINSISSGFTDFAGDHSYSLDVTSSDPETRPKCII